MELFDFDRPAAWAIHRIGPRYRFHTITGDADDDAFADCAIVAGADWIITADRHFDALIGSGYRPQPIAPDDFYPAASGRGVKAVRA